MICCHRLEMIVTSELAGAKAVKATKGILGLILGSCVVAVQAAEATMAKNFGHECRRLTHSGLWHQGTTPIESVANEDSTGSK